MFESSSFKIYILFYKFEISNLLLLEQIPFPYIILNSLMGSYSVDREINKIFLS